MTAALRIISFLKRKTLKDLFENLPIFILQTFIDAILHLSNRLFLFHIFS